MATATTTVSAWGKAGAWALDSEKDEAEQVQQQEESKSYRTPQQQQQQIQPLSDFPDLSMAAATKTKKKKPQTVSLSEFTSGKSVTHGSGVSKSSPQIGKGLTTDELLLLPTGPRERSEEELQNGGRGFRSYGDGARNGGMRREGEDRRRSDRESNREPLGPSRADENDDWGAGKKSGGFSGSGGSGFDRRDRGGFFENSQSRADESDSWVSKKSFVPSEPRRNGGFGERRRDDGGFGERRRDDGGFGERRRDEGGFGDRRREDGAGADSETWGRRKEEGGGGGRGFQRERESLNGGGADSDMWGKKREEGLVNGGGSRPRLVLQPRTVPVTVEEPRPGSGSGSRSKGPGSNPFGEARPREEVLKEKGQDWKKIDEQLEAVKIKEVSPTGDVSAFGKKSFGSGNGRMSSPENRTERSWKKVVLADAPTPSEEKPVENGNATENGVAEEN